MSDELRDTTALPLSITDVARIWRKVYGGVRADALAFEFADAIMRAALAAQPPAAMPVPAGECDSPRLCTELGRCALQRHTLKECATWPPVEAPAAQPESAQPVPATGAQPWQPIETAPKDGTMFLCWVAAERYSSPDGECSSHAHDTSQVDFCWWRPVDGSPDGGYFDNGAGQIGDSQDVTRWQPLPAPPMAAAHTGSAAE